MTKPRHNPKRFTPFSLWISNHPDLDSKKYFLDVQDIDFLPHLYRDGKLMMLELKEGYENFPDFAQRDTHSVVWQLLKFACKHPDCIVQREHPARPNKITWHGYHVIQTERTSPENGGVRVDGRQVSIEQLVQFLRFDLPLSAYEEMEQTREDIFKIRSCGRGKDFDEVKKYFQQKITKDHPQHAILIDTWIDQYQWLANNKRKSA